MTIKAISAYRAKKSRIKAEALAAKAPDKNGFQFYSGRCELVLQAEQPKP